MSDAAIVLARPRPTAELQWLLMHHAGGSSFPYLQLAHKLSAANEVYCLELAGRGSRFMEPLQFDAAATLASIVAGVRQHGLGRHRPLVLFGHSLGAELAFQLAGQLQVLWPQMKLGLLLSARGFNDASDTETAVNSHISDQEILGLLQQYGGTPVEVLADAELRRHVIGVMRSDLALLADLCRLPKRVLDVPIQLVGGDGDVRVPVSSLAAWQQVFNRAVTPKTWAGGHFYLFSNPDFVPWLERYGREFLTTPPLSVGPG